MAVNPSYQLNALNAGYSLDKSKNSVDDGGSFLESNTTKPSNLHDSMMQKSKQKKTKFLPDLTQDSKLSARNASHFDSINKSKDVELGYDTDGAVVDGHQKFNSTAEEMGHFQSIQEPLNSQRAPIGWATNTAGFNPKSSLIGH